MPSRNTRGRVHHPVQTEESHASQSRPSTASGHSSSDQGTFPPAGIPFSQPDQSDSQNHYPYGSAESAVYEASLQLRNPNGLPPNPPEPYQLNLTNGSISRPSTSGPAHTGSRDPSQPVTQYQQFGQSDSQSTFGYAPDTDFPAHPYNPNENIDPSLQRDATGNSRPAIQRFNSEQFSRHSTPNDFGGTFQAFAAPNGAEADGQKKRGASSTATNDKELREILAANEGRSLRDVATEVLKTERTPKAEKTKQLFAMLWYVCLSPNE
ncbi:MAG: hypothetical protein Q9165_004632 [Trypethelium subeluteriae]